MRSRNLSPPSNKGSTIHKNSIKTIVLGASDAGKTALVTRCLTDQFFQHYFTRSDVAYHIEQNNIVMDIIDSSGKNEALISYADCIVMVYSCTDRSSFQHLEKLLVKVRHLNLRNAVIAVVGTKNDKNKYREVLTVEGESFASENQCIFFETSSYIPKYSTKDEIFLRLGKEAKLRNRRLSETHHHVTHSIMGSIRNIMPRKRANTVS